MDHPHMKGEYVPRYQIRPEATENQEETFLIFVVFVFPFRISGLGVLLTWW